MKAISFQLPAAGWFRLDAFGFISRNCITVISGLRPLPPPLWCLRHHLSPKGKHVTGFSVAYGSLRIQFLCHPAKAGAQQPVLYLEPLMNTKVRGALLSHRLRGEGGGASHQRGPPPTGGIKNGACGRPPPQSVSRLKGRPLIGQARGQLRLTCVSHAGYAQSGTI